MIPLYRAHFASDVHEKLREVLDSGRIAFGPQVGNFESKLGALIGNRRLVATCDGPAALTLALYLAGVRPGDEVVASPMACLSTNIPILNLFAKAIWCDIDETSGTLHPQALTSSITERTKAILVNHWVGYPADLEPILKIARSRDIPVIDEVSESLGASYQGQPLGNAGTDFSVFSFYANRHLTTIDGGAISFLHENHFQQARRLRHFGIDQATFRSTNGEINPLSDISVAGWSYRMNHVAAAVGLAQLTGLDELIAIYRRNGKFYEQHLAEIPGIRLLHYPCGSQPSYWVFTLLAERADFLLNALHERGVCASRVHLRNDIYSCFGSGSNELPGVQSFSEQAISIPCGWWVTSESRQHIVDSIRRGW